MKFISNDKDLKQYIHLVCYIFLIIEMYVCGVIMWGCVVRVRVRDSVWNMLMEM